MFSKLKVVVLIHENDKKPVTSNYFIRLLIKEWRDTGITIRIIQGIDHFVKADIIIPHIDLTVIPDRYFDYMDRYPVVINNHVLDISKTKISTNIVGQNDLYKGPVIVKTNCNCGGLPEKRLSAKSHTFYSPLSKLTRKFMSKSQQKQKDTVPWRSVETLNPNDYPIYSSLKEVPDDIFNNRNLVIEKFLPEIEADKYCLRNWLFFGDRGVNILSRSSEMVIKASNTFQHEEVPVPDGLYSIRQQLRVDYGKFDYVLHDGKVVLFDVNRTPTFKGPEPSQFVCRAAHLLAEGIWSQVT